MLTAEMVGSRSPRATRDVEAGGARLRGDRGEIGIVAERDLGRLVGGRRASVGSGGGGCEVARRSAPITRR